MIKIHHISCGSFCVPARRLVEGKGSLFESAHFGCHCFVVEDNKGLILVDTGLGAAGIKNHFPLIEKILVQPDFSLESTAFHQVKQLGFKPTDVRHLIPTHLDFDHAGGMPDFPQAAVHVLKAERDAAMSSDRRAYKQHLFDHNPKWQCYEQMDIEWFGFKGVRLLANVDAEVLLIPLIGHSAGHCGVAVNRGDKWLLHTGDLFYNRAELTHNETFFMRKYTENLALDNQQRLYNVARVQQLIQNNSDEVLVLSAHDPDDFRVATGG